MNAREVDAELARAWQALTPGENVGPVTYRVTDRAIDAYCEATEDHGAWHVQASPYGPRVAQPTLTTTDYGQLMAGKGLSLGYHARHHAEFLAPLRLGDTLTATGCIADVFIRRGFRYYTLDYQATNQQGELAYRQSITTSVGVLRDSTFGGARRTAVLPAPAHQEQEMPPLVRLMTQEKMNRFASQTGIRFGREPTVPGGHHTDPAYAKAVGLQGTIAQALHYVGWVSEAMTRELGQGWVAGGVLDMVFVNSAGPDDTLTLRFWPTNMQPGQGRASFHLAAQNQRAELVAVGDVSGLRGSKIAKDTPASLR